MQKSRPLLTNAALYLELLVAAIFGGKKAVMAHLPGGATEGRETYRYAASSYRAKSNEGELRKENLKSCDILVLWDLDVCLCIRVCVSLDVLEYSHMFQQLYCTKQDPVHISLVSHTLHTGRKGPYNCTTLT